MRWRKRREPVREQAALVIIEDVAGHPMFNVLWRSMEAKEICDRAAAAEGLQTEDLERRLAQASYGQSGAGEYDVDLQDIRKLAGAGGLGR